MLSSFNNFTLHGKVPHILIIISSYDGHNWDVANKISFSLTLYIGYFTCENVWICSVNLLRCSTAPNIMFPGASRGQLWLKDPMMCNNSKYTSNVYLSIYCTGQCQWKWESRIQTQFFMLVFIWLTSSLYFYIHEMWHLVIPRGVWVGWGYIYLLVCLSLSLGCLYFYQVFGSGVSREPYKSLSPSVANFVANFEDCDWSMWFMQVILFSSHWSVNGTLRPPAALSRVFHRQVCSCKSVQSLE